MREVNERILQRVVAFDLAAGNAAWTVTRWGHAIREKFHSDNMHLLSREDHKCSARMVGVVEMVAHSVAGLRSKMVECMSSVLRCSCFFFL